MPPPLSLEDLLGAAPPPPREDPVDDEELALLTQLTSRHFQQHRPDPASFPAQALRAMELVRQPDVDLRKLTALVAQDPVLGARVLRVANSPAFNRGQEVADLLTAITRLGVREVTDVVVGVAGQALFDPQAKAEYQLFSARWNALFHHAMTSAMAAAQLAQDVHRGHSATAFMGGLFHDLGKSIALRSVCALALDGTSRLHPQDPAIDRLLEAVHVDIGAQMHATWKLPAALGELCRHHHDAEVPAGAQWDDVHVVRVASGLVALRTAEVPEEALAAQVAQSLGALGLGREVLPNLRRRIEQHAARVTTLFEVEDPAVEVRARLAAARGDGEEPLPATSS